jgi:VanZ family protein
VLRFFLFAIRIAAVLSVAAIVVLSLLPAKPTSGISNGQLEHGLAYVSAGVLVGLSLRSKVIASLLLILLAGILELAQTGLPGRQAQFVDVVASGAAALLGVLVASRFSHLLHG